MTRYTQDQTIELAEMNMADDAQDSPVATAQSHALSTQASQNPQWDDAGGKSSGNWMVWLGNTFALLWIGAAGAFIWGYLGIQSLDALAQYGFGQLTGLRCSPLLRPCSSS